MTNFRYFNANPDKSVEEDCVTRAISVSSKIPYRSISRLLEITAKEHDCDKLCVCCYHHLLEDILGYRVIFPKGYKTVGEIADMYENNAIIVRIDGHLTTCMYGTCVDIWDCTDEKVDCFWIVQ